MLISGNGLRQIATIEASVPEEPEIDEFEAPLHSPAYRFAYIFRHKTLQQLDSKISHRVS